MTYEEFKEFLRQEGETRATQGGLLAIPDLRSRVPLERPVFDEYVHRLHAERVIHLLSHVDGGACRMTSGRTAWCTTAAGSSTGSAGCRPRRRLLPELSEAR